jgi:CDP-3, 6-dideoxy-D-glycero-L-glycero-4-hexulose-4-reductase
VNLYAASKQAAEDLLRHFHRNRGLSCVTLELFDIYGIDDTRRKLLSLIRDTVREGGCLDMTAGEQVMDLTHVEDVVEAFLLSARWLLAEESPLFERRSVCGERLRVRDLVGLIERSNGGRPVARLGVLPYRERELMLPPAPLAPVPGWSLCRGIQADFVELLFPRGDRART